METLKNIDEPGAICSDEDSTSFQMNNEGLIYEAMLCNDPANSSKHTDEVFKIEDGQREPYIEGRSLTNADRKKDKCIGTVLNEERNVMQEQKKVANLDRAIRGEEYVDEEGFWYMDMGEEMRDDSVINDTPEVMNEISRFENKIKGKGSEEVDNEMEVQHNREVDSLGDGEHERVEDDREVVKVGTKDERQDRLFEKSHDYQKLRKCVVIVENIKELKKFKKIIMDLNEEGDNKDGMTTVKQPRNEQRIVAEKLVCTSGNDEIVDFEDQLKEASLQQPGKFHTDWTGCFLPTMEEILPTDNIQEPDKMVEDTGTCSMKIKPTVSLHISSTNSEENQGHNAIRRMKKRVYAHKVAGFNGKEVNGEARKPIKFKTYSDTWPPQENKGERNVIRNEDKSERRKYIENYHPHDKNEDRLYSFGKFERSCFVRVSRLPSSMYCTLRHCSVSLYPLPRYLIPTKNNCLRLPQEMVTKVRKKASKKSKKTVVKTKRVGDVYERNQTSKARCTFKNASFWKDGFFLFKRSSRKSTSPYKISSKRERFCRHCLHCG